MDTDEVLMPIVSIIVPVYNAQRFIGECLDSLSKQTLHEIEILAIDDGSIDSSPDILDNYAEHDRRFKVIHKENSGVSATRNMGIEKAQGAYVMFVDADDYIRLDSCEKLVSIAERENAEIVVFGGRTFPKAQWADDSFANRECVYKRSYVIEGLMGERGSRPFMCNKLYKRALLERIHARLSTKLTLGEDQAFQMCVFPHAKCVAYTGEILYFYRNHEGSSLSFGPDVHDMRVMKHLDVVDTVVNYWKEQGLLASYGGALLNWLMDFIYGDMQYVSFNLREQACARLERIVRENFKHKHEEGMNSLNIMYWREMSECVHVMEKQPFVTFVLSSADGSALQKENLQAILCQNEQRIACLIDERCLDSEIEAIIENDKRCECIPESTLAEVMALVQSPYTILATSNCRYSRKSAKRLSEHIELLNSAYNASLTPDAVIFNDSMSRIRLEELFYKGHPSVDKPLDDRGVLAFDDLGGRGFAVCGLSTVNKMFSSDFLRGHCPRGFVGSYSIQVQAALSLQFASSLYFIPQCLVSYGSFAGDGSGAEWPLAEYVREMASYRQHLDADELQAYDTALAHYCLAIDDAIAGGSYNPSLAGAMLSVLGNLTIDSADGASFAGGESDAKQLGGLAAMNSDTHRIESLEINLERAISRNEEIMESLEKAEEKAYGLAGAVKEFEESISYRVGRVVTLPIRVLYVGLGKLLSR